MERMRNVRTKGFTTVSNAYLRDCGLSLKAKGLLTVIMSFPENWEFTVAGLVAICKEARTAIYSTIKELIKAGYCKRKYLYINGKRSGVDYIFLEDKELLNSENLNSGNLNLENLNLGFETQLNTNNIINKTFNKDSLSGEFFAFKNEKIEKKIPPHVAHTPPTLQQVEDFFEGKIPKDSTTPQRFYNTMTAKGWVHKGDVIVDWQKIAENWIAKERNTPKETKKQNYKPQQNFKALGVQNYGTDIF